MNTEQMAGLERRARVHAALADTARLRITDALADGDASPSELAAMLGMPSNQHVQVMGEQVGRHPQHRRKLRGGGVPVGERVGDPQPRRVGERGVHRGAPLQVVILLSIH